MSDLKIKTMPWMGFRHTAQLGEYVAKAKSILEWGCGGSTLWMAQIATGTVVSIEHNEAWRDAILHCLRQLDNEYHTLAVMPDVVAGNMADGFVSLIAKDFDLVFVDGIARPACMVESWKILLPGGHLFLHDSERPQYDEAKAKLIELGGVVIYDQADPTFEAPQRGLWQIQKPV